VSNMRDPLGLPRDSRIYVAGHNGLAGSALVRALKRSGYESLITRTHAELELTDQKAVRSFMRAERPDFVFLAAGRVGGIVANDTYPADFISTNLAIQSNVIDECARLGVKRLLFLGSSCIYPRDCPQPIKEEYLLTGPLESTNRAYALAKIAGVEMCAAYNRQHSSRYLAVMPTNLFGPQDNYDLETGHVLPALIRKVHEAKEAQRAQVTIWGSGKPRREFLHSDDLADACLFLMNLPDKEFDALLTATAAPLVNVGTGEDQTILELAELIRDVVGFSGSFALDGSKPDGTSRKLLDVSRIQALGWRSTIPLREGIERVYRDFQERLSPP
jgi:GDP-L-fucose synthase